MARPGEQWTMRKEAYQRIRDAFDAHGLNFAERNVKVEVVGGGSSSVVVDGSPTSVSAASSAEDESGSPQAAASRDRTRSTTRTRGTAP